MVVLNQSCRYNRNGSKRGNETEKKEKRGIMGGYNHGQPRQVEEDVLIFQKEWRLWVCIQTSRRTNQSWV